MPESSVLMNDTYIQVKNSINIALNTLLNEPSAELFEPQTSNFRTSAIQVDGNMEYSFQEGDAKTPISFLNELKTPTVSTTTVSPMTTSRLIVTSAATHSKIPTSAVVYSRLVFKSSSPVPSESLVLNATNTLLNSRRANLSNSTQVLNVTYEKISETSYAVIFTISVSNISMPESPVLMNGTYTQLKNSVNIALNTLLNEPSAELFEPQSSDFRTSANRVDGNMQYSFQEGDAKTPISFLNELKTQTGNTPTMPPIAITALQSTTVPTPEISTTSVLDRTTSTIMKITTSPTPEITAAPPQQITAAPPQQITTAPPQQITAAPPQQITAAPPQQITAAPTLVGTVLIYIRLVFKNLTTLPSEAEVLNAASALLDSSVRMKRDVSTQKLSNPVSIQNVTYQKTSSNSYTISFAFKISNVNISKNIELRNETYDAIQNTINGLLNKILNNPNAPPFVFQRANYTGNDTVIQANAEYVFVEGDIKTPSGFLKEILNIPERTTSTIMEITTSSTLDITTVPHQQNTIAPTLEITAVPPQEITAAPPQQITAAPPQQITAAPPQQITAAPTLVGTVLIYIRLVFKNLTTLPSEAEVLNAASALLDSSVRMKRDVSTQKLSNPVSIQNVTYQKTSSNSYTISFAFKISNVNMSRNIELRNETYDAIQNTINGLLNKILNDPNAPPFVFQRANYTGNDTVIQANAEYVFVEGDIKTPSGFLKEILKISGLAGGGFPGWALAIIIPCGIAIILVPCWIILCIMLSGCCAAVRRRWHRRRSYNVEYPIHNSLF
ncbi:hypothetical protein SRHO_G00048280 [Serrasalmus rhombeus]